MTLTLAAGPHALRIDFTNTGGRVLLQLAWKPHGAGALAAVPASRLSH